MPYSDSPKIQVSSSEHANKVFHMPVYRDLHFQSVFRILRMEDKNNEEYVLCVCVGGA